MQVSEKAAKKWKSKGKHRTFVEKRGRKTKQAMKDAMIDLD